MELHDVVRATDGYATCTWRVGSTTGRAIGRELRVYRILDGHGSRPLLPLVRSLGHASARLTECRDGDDVMESERVRWTRGNEA